MAEGVEDRDDLAVVQSLGSAYGQGFLLWAPRPLAQVGPLEQVSRAVPS